MYKCRCRLLKYFLFPPSLFFYVALNSHYNFTLQIKIFLQIVYDVSHCYQLNYLTVYKVVHINSSLTIFTLYMNTSVIIIQ